MVAFDRLRLGLLLLAGKIPPFQLLPLLPVLAKVGGLPVAGGAVGIAGGALRVVVGGREVPKGGSTRQAEGADRGTLQVPAGRMFAPGAVGGKWALLLIHRGGKVIDNRRLLFL